MVIVRYAEIGIKGKNRARFERALVQNIESCLRSHKVPFSSVWKMYGRILIETEDKCEQLQHVFGIASFSQAARAGTTIAEAAVIAAPLVSPLTAGDSFRIACQRVDKKFPLSSQDVCVQLGGLLCAQTRAKVRMQQPTVTVNLEIIQGAIYVLAKRTEGPGGMPLGSQGIAIALMEDEASVLAALLVMRRGCRIVPAMLKNVDLASLRAIAHGQWVPQVTITSMAELDALAARHGASAVVVNDTLDRVREIGLNAIVLRPLSGYSREELGNVRKSVANLLDAC